MATSSRTRRSSSSTATSPGKRRTSRSARSMARGAESASMPSRPDTAQTSGPQPSTTQQRLAATTQRLASSARGVMSWGRRHPVAAGSLLVAAAGIGVATYALLAHRAARAGAASSEDDDEGQTESEAPRFDVESLTTSQAPHPPPIPTLHPDLTYERHMKPRRERAP